MEIKKWEEMLFKAEDALENLLEQALEDVKMLMDAETDPVKKVELLEYLKRGLKKALQIAENMDFDEGAIQAYEQAFPYMKRK